MLYEDPTKDVTTDERFHVELHFSPGVNCCVQKELVPGPGFRQVPSYILVTFKKYMVLIYSCQVNRLNNWFQAKNRNAEN